MSETTPRFGLPYIMPSQAQKHLTHNEALREIDTLVQIAVASRTATTPPPEPSEGDAYLVPDTDAAGPFAGREDQLASYRDGAWSFRAPSVGWLVYVEDEARLIVLSAEGWLTVTPGEGDSLSVASLGINTEAETFNRLAVKSDSALLCHAADAGGSGDFRLALNKLNAGSTATLVLQDNWSGRAELGLAGDDNLTIKVSPDGSTFTQALTVDRNNARVKIGNSSQPANAPLHVRDALAYTGGYAKPFKAHSENAATGDTVQFSFGQSETNYNQAEFNFKLLGGPGSTSNFFALGLFGLPQIIKAIGTGAVQLPAIGTTASAANAFIDSGAANSILRSTSSVKYKTDIEPLDPRYADALMALEPIWYRSTCAADDPAWSWYGFAAEDVAAIDPRLVHYGYDEEDYETVEIEDDEGKPHPERVLKEGAEKSPQGVAYDRFVVIQHLLISRLTRRVADIESRLTGS